MDEIDEKLESVRSMMIGILQEMDKLEKRITAIETAILSAAKKPARERTR